MRGLGIVLMLGMCMINSAVASGTATACDATTTASVKVVGIKTTTSSATITWTEGKHNGGRKFQYGLSATSYGPATDVQSRASGAKDEKITGLTANTKYFYQFYGIWKGGNRSFVNGTFITDGSACGTSVITTVEVTGFTLTAQGDSLENVTVTIINPSTGAVVGKDYTDASGGYVFMVNPSSTAYQVTYSYPPFTPPAPYSALVKSGATLTIPNQVLKDAFQLGGLVLPSVGGTPIKSALVTITSKADPSVLYERQTDLDGHFSVGVKPGIYLVNAVANGKTLSAPVSVDVKGTMEMPSLVLSATVGIRSKSFSSATQIKPNGVGYNAKGERRLEKAGKQNALIQFKK